MICVYVVNEEPAYIGMISISLKTLRAYNPNLKVIVYFVKDSKKDSRKISLNSIVSCFKSYDIPLNFDTFSSLCEKLNIELRIRNSNLNQQYYSLHRLFFKEIKEEKVLLIDSDTFIFENIEHFSESYKDFDFVATPNEYGLHHSIPGFPEKFKSFNSGVVFCQSGIFQKWICSIEKYCSDLYDGKHKLSKWLWSVSPNCEGREELSASLFVNDNNVKYGYFAEKHVQMGNFSSKTAILHTLTPNYLSFLNKFFIRNK